MLAEAQKGHLKAMWIMGADPIRRSSVARDALGQIPFLVVQDLFLTETASRAHVVLPAASFAETEGSYTNLTGRWQAVNAAKRPPADARPDWWVFVELAQRMVGEKQKKVWDFSDPLSVLGEITKVLGAQSEHFRGLDYISMGPGGRQRPEPRRAARRSFLRVDPDPPSLDASYPLGLVTGHLPYDRGVFLRCSEQLQNLVPDPFVMIHPADAESLNLADGDDVSVVSSRGELNLPLRVSDEIAPGVAFAPLNLGEVSPSVLCAINRTSTRVRITRLLHTPLQHAGE
jgi:predicted molibdopterin-dependent oxidoreductase YjgC